jgi:DNA-binding winged helix-turn-helix (wHTH) protein/tetratricopeptide (TPR) repeat protein/type II secretory pathway predicted ATPase ExeA
MIYQFGDCEVDTKLLEVRRDGERCPLEPLEFDLLVFLIEHRDRVITRDELLDALWPGRVVTDSALSSRIKAVRAAVGDTGKAQSIVKTVHGRGYRFVAELSNVPAPVAAPATAATVIPKTAAVGRDAEIGKLTRWLDRASGGHRETVLICGEAGVGKTTLTRAFLNSLDGHPGLLVLHGQCVDQRGASEPYMPMLEALGRAGQSEPSMVATLQQHAPTWIHQLPALMPKRDPEIERAVAGTTPGRMLREISDALEVIARDRPVVFVLEDLHWSDPSTIEWLDYYARRSDNARLMLIATGRPEGPQQSVFRDLGGRGHAHAIQLESIDESCISDYLTARLEHPPSPALAALTFSRTDGFPLFIDALVDQWLETGLVQKLNGHWAAAAAEDELLEGVPENLSQLIEQQLAGLQEEERLLLETASLAGSPFSAAAVAHAIEQSDETTEALFGRMARSGRLIRNAGEDRWPDGTVTATFEFRHELYRQALYESIPASRRARLHLALGDRLETAWGERATELAGEIADHFARAHQAARALKYFYPAAMKSFNRSANREAVATLNNALAQIDTLPESTETKRAQRELHLLRASALISLEGWASDGVEESYTRAQEIAKELQIKDGSPERYGIAAMHELRGLYAKSQAVLESLMKDTPTLGLEAHELLACSLFHQGQFDRSKESADRAVEKYNPEEVSHILARYGENPGVCCHGWASLDLWFMGYPDTSLERSDEALHLAEEHVYSLASALTYRTFLHQFRNEPEEVVKWSSKTIEVAARQGFEFRVAQAAIMGGWAKATLSNDAETKEDALAQMRKALDDHFAMGAEMDAPYYQTLIADVYRQLDRLDDALELQEEAIESTSGGRSFFYEAEMHRSHAQVLLARGDREAATDAINLSLDIARRQGATMLELRSAVMLARLDDDAKQVKKVNALLENLTEGQDSPDLQAATALGT